MAYHTMSGITIMLEKAVSDQEMTATIQDPTGNSSGHPGRWEPKTLWGSKSRKKPQEIHDFRPQKGVHFDDFF